MKKYFLSSLGFMVLGSLLVGQSALAATNPVTGSVGSITQTDAILNGTNGDTDAIGHSFWVSDSTFATDSPTIPPGVYSTVDMGAIAAGASFSASLTSDFTGFPGATANTPYYFAAWSNVSGTWYPGEVLSFTTLPGPVFIDTNSNSVFDEGELDFDTIEAAVSASVPGDIIIVTEGPFVLNSTINLNKDITLKGMGNPLIQVSGSNILFNVSATGVTIQGFQIQKTDKLSQTLIHIASSDTTIESNEIFGDYVVGEGDVARAMVLQGGLTGINIANNTIHDLRQPAYVSGVTTGTVSNNYVYKTKGWVIEQGDLTFTDNTWGEGANANVYDIAILATVGASYYTNIPAMSAANNDASIEDQRGVSATLSLVYVDGSVEVSGTGTQNSPKKTLTEGVMRVVEGGKIVLLSNLSTASTVEINKSLTLEGGDSTLTASAGLTGTVLLITSNDVTVKNLTVDGGGLPVQGIQAYKVTGILLDNITAQNTGKSGIMVNGSTLTVNNVETLNNNWHGINVDQGSGVTTLAELTVNGTSVHTEVGPDIFVDNNTKGSVVDNNDQYSTVPVGLGTAYYLFTKFTLTYIAGANGSITGNLSQDVIEGQDGTTVTAVANDGYHFDSWSDGLTTAARTDTNVTGALSFTANFAIDQSSGGNSGSRRATPATPATPAVPGVSPATPATPATPGQVLGAEKFIFTLFLKKGPPYNVGTQGNEVMELQKFLNAAGFGILAVDGKFGPLTEAAVIKFQLANGLVGDGIVGPLTRAVLNK